MLLSNGAASIWNGFSRTIRHRPLPRYYSSASSGPIAPNARLGARHSSRTFSCLSRLFRLNCASQTQCGSFCRICAARRCHRRPQSSNRRKCVESWLRQGNAQCRRVQHGKWIEIERRIRVCDRMTTDPIWRLAAARFQAEPGYEEVLWPRYASAMAAVSGAIISMPILLARHGNLDYLTLEYLAELTMSILALQKQKHPEAGFATDFLDVLGRLTSELRPAAAQDHHQCGGHESNGLGAKSPGNFGEPWTQAAHRGRRGGRLASQAR